MKKNDLIRLLQQTPGNPEIKLWNGYVSDFMNVGGLVESDLVKMTKEYFLETLRLEKCSDLKDWDMQLTPEEIEQDELERRRTVRDFDKYCRDIE